MRERDIVVPLGDRQRADRLGRGLIGKPLDRQAAAAQRDRRRVVQAVVVLDAEVAVVVDRQRGVVQRDRRRVRQRAVVAEGQRTAGQGGRTAEGLGAAELEREAADASEAQVGARDGTHERLARTVHVRHEVRRRGAGVRDRAAGVGSRAEGDQAADELRRAVEVERAVRLDVEEIGAAGPEGVVAGAKLERTAEDGRLAAVILLTRDRERAGSLLGEVGIGDHRARQVKRRRRVDGHEGRGVDRGGGGTGDGRVAADRERGAVRDAGDEGVARDARAGDHLADREAGGAGDRDRRRSVRRGDARRRDEVQAGNRERMRDAARGEDGAGRDRQGVTGRGGERAGGRVGDREATQGPVGSDVVHRVAGTDLQDITGGAGRDVGDGGVTGEGRDAVGRIIGAEVRPGDEEAGDQAGRAARAEDIRELELIGHRQARRGRDVERAARVGEGRVVERRECQDVRASAREIDDGITVGAEHGHRLGRVRSVADHVQATAFEVDRAAGETTRRVVRGDVVEREDTARADDRTVTGGREDSVQGASRAADRNGAAFDH